MEFLIDSDDTGRFVWRALDDQGNELVHSEPLATHDDCVHAILALKVEASSAPTHDLTRLPRATGREASAAAQKRRLAWLRHAPPARTRAARAGAELRRRAS